MCGGTTSSNGGNQSAREKKGARSGSLFGVGPLRGGRGSPAGTRDKSTFEKQASGSFASLVGSLIGGPGLGTAFKGIADSEGTFDVNLATGKRAPVVESGSVDTSSDKRQKTAALKAESIQANGTPKEKAATIMADTQDKRKKAKAKVSAASTRRTPTLLAGRKIAEDKLKKALGQ